ncbi:MAG: argininosuccinate lyase [Candidatus Helarchaeales archaeon]
MTKKKAWSGRFDKDVQENLERYLCQEDLKFDERLILHSITGTEAHNIMLHSIGALSENDLKAILKELEGLKEKVKQGQFQLRLEHEDVQMNIEQAVAENLDPKVAGMIHLARSRNDQVMLDLRSYMREKILELIDVLLEACDSILTKASDTANVIMPGYTHLQHAQPITFGFWCLSHIDNFLRIINRLDEAFSRVNQNPLGAGALAGVSWPIKREMTTKLLGFDGIHENALDVISSRGELEAELVFILTLLMTHLSKISNDLILWSTHEFGMITLDDSHATGSSIMPQKKNPDPCEIMRARAGTMAGWLFQILSILKGMPSGYNRDYQETKGPMMLAFDVAKDSVLIIQDVIKALEINEKRMSELAGANFSTATDLIDLLMKKTAVSFRMAHEMVGQLVGECVKKGLEPKQVTFQLLKPILDKHSIKDVILKDKEIQQALDPLEAVKRKSHVGGSAPQEVKRMISERKKKIIELKERNLTKKEKIKFSLDQLQELINQHLK